MNNSQNLKQLLELGCSERPDLVISSLSLGDRVRKSMSKSNGQKCTGKDAGAGAGQRPVAIYVGHPLPERGAS